MNKILKNGLTVFFLLFLNSNDGAHHINTTEMLGKGTGWGGGAGSNDPA